MTIKSAWQRKYNRKSFTLIEVLLVVSLLSVISLAVYHTLSNCIKVWQRANRAFLEADIAIFFEKVNHELKNSVFFSQIPFDGKSAKLDFATVIKTSPDAQLELTKNRYIPQPGRVEYFFNSGNLYRKQANYSQALKGKFGGPQVLIKGLKSVKFSYYYSGKDGPKLYKEAKNIIPAAITINLEFGEGQEIRKTVSIPIGS